MNDSWSGQRDLLAATNKTELLLPAFGPTDEIVSKDKPRNRSSSLNLKVMSMRASKLDANNAHDLNCLSLSAP